MPTDKHLEEEEVSDLEAVQHELDETSIARDNIAEKLIEVQKKLDETTKLAKRLQEDSERMGGRRRTDSAILDDLSSHNIARDEIDAAIATALGLRLAAFSKWRAGVEKTLAAINEKLDILLPK